jgi:hypothetical protein
MFVLIIVIKVLFSLRRMFAACLNLDGWDGDLNLGTDAEANIRDYAAQYLQDQTKTSS